jgi:hypothetical protein
MAVKGVGGPGIAGNSGEKRRLRRIRFMSVRWVTYRNKQAAGVSCTLKTHAFGSENRSGIYETNGSEHDRARVGSGRLRRRDNSQDHVHAGGVDPGNHHRYDLPDHDDRSGHEAQEAEGAPQAQARDDDCGRHDAGAPGHDAFLASARHHDERSGPGGRGSEPEWREQQRWRRDDEHEQPGLRPGSAGLLTAGPPRAAGCRKKLRLLRSFFPSASREPDRRVARHALAVG